MNYRHAYHAGNFADVLKHVVLTRVLVYMQLKPQPFRCIDTHAGAGLYDLASVEAGKTGEWRDGIGRIETAAAPADVAALLAPYLDAVRAQCGSTGTDGALGAYPGSPLLARQLMRPCDTLIANELHPEDGARLRDVLKGARYAKVMALDGWVAIKSLLPPPERRGVVLIDPPFESADEFLRLEAAIGEGLRRFAQGVFVVWYPVKDEAGADRFISAVRQFGRPLLDVRLSIGKRFRGLGLTETGIVIINPPYALAAELQTLLPWLQENLAQDSGAHHRLQALG